jgi:hypothetical protein
VPTLADDGLQVALRLTKLLASDAYAVTSIIRDTAHAADILAANPAAATTVLSLEESPTTAFTDAFSGQDVVVWSAGAGGKGGEARTKAVDYEGALKVFDALEAVAGAKPRLILVSAIDVRNPEVVPEHYVRLLFRLYPLLRLVLIRAFGQTEDDIAMSKRVRGAIAAYMHWKYEADKNLVARTAFQWTILRPGGLTDGPGAGTASIGRTHLSPTISVRSLSYLYRSHELMNMSLLCFSVERRCGEGAGFADRET